jgi:c-di-GMP-binding flagellar brake protein YcgR
MLRDILTLGDKIDVKKLDRNGKPLPNVRTLISQLVNIGDTDIIHIAAPIIYGKVIILEVGEYYNLCIYTNKGLYQCNCIILSNHRENNTIVSVVRIMTKLEKYQRRQYYRLECVIPIQYRIITIEERILENKLKLGDFRNTEERSECRKKLNHFNLEWLPASITDLSGGGVRFNSSMNHSPSDNVRLRLELTAGGELRKLELNADIISSNRLENRSDIYEQRAVFSDILQKDRDFLIKYIFEQERQRRKNEKL